MLKFLCTGNNVCMQVTLWRSVEKWKIMLDKKGYAGTALMDLSRAFDTINYELLTTKPILGVCVQFFRKRRKKGEKC